MGISNLHYYVPAQKADKPIIVEKDLIIYGGTPAGLTAAIQATRMGLTVAVVEFTQNIGGMTASGLGATDLGSEEAVGGLSKEFYQEVANHYNKDKQWSFEPKVAQQIFAR